MHLSVETDCLGWVVPYLLCPTNILRRPALFGTLKSVFSSPHVEVSLGGIVDGGLRRGCHMAYFLFSVEFVPLGFLASKCTHDSLTDAFWYFMLFVITDQHLSL